jgi:hypothetical protein
MWNKDVGIYTHTFYSRALCAICFETTTRMKNNFLLSTFLLALTIIGCSQTSGTKKTTVTADFLYGAWADSLKDQSGGQGIILGTKNDFYFIWDGNISGGDNFDTNIKLTYNLKLDKDPIEVEIISKYVDTDKIKKKGLGTIKIIDDQHIIWRMLDDNGKAVDSVRLTKAPNQ